MSTTALQSSSVPIYLSPNGSTYYMIVCKRGVTFNMDYDLSDERKDCGTIAVPVGSVNWSFDIDAIVNVTPDIGTAFSYEQILAWVNGQTSLYVRWNYPDTAGTDFKHQGQGYLKNLRSQVQQGNAMNFTVTFNGTGDLTIA
jgi:hypothetical protein